jgi:cytochrome P450
MRDAGPVHLVRESNGLRRWLVLRYAEGRGVFADDRFAKSPALAWKQLRDAGYVTGEPQQRASYINNLATTDPPDHTRLRRLISNAFTVRRIEALRPRAQRLANELLDRMEPFKIVDLVETYSHPFATTIMCEILGVSDINREGFRTWATAILTAPDSAPAGGLTKEEGYAAMSEFFAKLIAKKRAEKNGGANGREQSDVLTALIAARDDDDKLTESEMVATVMLLMSAGQEPTANLITNGVLALLQHPGELQKLRDNPALIPSAVEEFLRYDPPVELSTTRFATEDVNVAGKVIPAKSIVTVSIASANRDERQITNADKFDITRSDQSHLAFGHGIHHCIGAPLARMEAQVCTAALIRRFPNITPAFQDGDLRWRPTRIMRGLVELPVNLRAR